MKFTDHSFQEKIISLDRVRLNTAIRKGSGQSVICLHGLSGNLNSWTPFLDRLPENDFHFLAYDLRGRGNSEKPKTGYGLDNHVQDLKALIDHFQIKNPVFLAHSFGCLIAIRFAVLFPESAKSIILLDGGGQVSFRKKLQILKVLKPSIERLGKLFPDKKTYLDLIKSSPIIPFWTPEMEDYFQKELHETETGFICHMPEFVMEEELQAMGGSSKEINIFINFFINPIGVISKIIRNRNLEYEKIRCPTLILRATEKNLEPGDDLLPRESFGNMLNKIPNSSGMEIATNHYGIIFEENRIRDQLIMDFLKNS